MLAFALPGTAIGTPTGSADTPEDAPEPAASSLTFDAPPPAPPAEAGGEQVLGPEACTDVFGDADIKAQNADTRAFDLSWIERRGDIVEITHSARWKRPYYVEFAGLEVVDVTMAEDGSTGSARVRLERGGDDGAKCRDGLYEVGPDLALGGTARVLGVIDEGLIVEHDGNLAYMLKEKALPPTWQMVWRAPWYIVRRKSSSASKSSASKSRSRSKAKSKSRARNNKSTKRR